MKKMLIALTMIVTLAVGVCAAFAQNAPAPPPAPPAPRSPRMAFMRPAPCIVPTLKLVSPHMLPMLSARLNLMEDQKTKLLDLLTKADESLKPKIENQIKLAREYANTLINDSAKQEDLAAAGEKVMKAETEVLMARIQTLFAVKALLTPEQNKQLMAFLAQYTSPWRETPTPPGPPQPTPPAPAK